MYIKYEKVLQISNKYIIDCLMILIQIISRSSTLTYSYSLSHNNLLQVTYSKYSTDKLLST